MKQDGHIRNYDRLYIDRDLSVQARARVARKAEAAS
jgi:hypothetical protein